MAENDRRRDEALRSALERLPAAVVVVEGSGVLSPYNKRAVAFFDAEAIRGDILKARPTHPLSVLLNTILSSAPDETMADAVISMPSGNRYHIEPSRRSDKGTGRMLLLLIRSWTAPKVGAMTVLDGWNLTDRERDVARQMLQGASTNEIATALGISANTLRTHVRRVLAKTSTRSRAEFVSKLMSSAER